MLFVEYLGAAVLFDGAALTARGGWAAELGGAGELVTAAVVVLTAGLVLNAAVLKRTLQELADQLDSVDLRWAGVHAVGHGVAMAATIALFGLQRSSPALDVSLPLLALVAEVSSQAALLRALFGRGGARSLASAFGRVALAGTLLGAAAWLAGVHLRPLWPHLASGTLTSAAWLLRALGSEVVVEQASATLGMRDFQVIVAPECSGVEGMALVAVFLGAYVLRFRGSLRLGRAVALVVVAVALAWCANTLRIAGLVALGASGLPEVAFGGFHSKAGWVLFCCIALSMVAVLDRSRLFLRPDFIDGTLRAGDEENPTADYCVPFLALLATSLITGLFAGDVDFLYPLHVLAALAGLAWGRSRLPAIERSVSWTGVGLGAAVFGAWVLLTPANPARSAEIDAALNGLALPLRLGWWAFRLFGTMLVVPVVEELAFRGFLQRRLVADDFVSLPYSRVNVWGVAGSALAFGFLHPSWWLGTLAGLAYSVASVKGGRLQDAIYAHATTNALLAAWALTFDRLDLFG